MIPKLLLILLFLPTFALAERVTPADNVENFITVRDRAKYGMEISILLTGDTAELLSTQEDTYYIILDGGLRGYVMKKWSALIADETVNNAIEDANEEVAVVSEVFIGPSFNLPLAPSSSEAQVVNVKPAIVTSIPQESQLNLPSQNLLAIHFIDVGHGDSTLVVCPDNSTILIDAGSTSTNIDSQKIREYILSKLGEDNKQLDTLLITHADPAHYNLLPTVLDGISIGHTYHIEDEQQYSSNSFNTWLSQLPEQNLTKLGQGYFDSTDSPHPDIRCGEAEIYILAANIKSQSPWRDPRSIVIKIQYKDFSAILTSDATTDTENMIMQRYSAGFLKADVLKLANHGNSATSNSSLWSLATQPFIAVLSAELGTGQDFSRGEVIDRISPYTLNQSDFSHSLTAATGDETTETWSTNKAYQELIYSTADSGNIVISSTGYDADIVTSQQNQD